MTLEYFVICSVAVLASGLTFISGFGLGTVLMPAMALFFPVPVAIAATAVVHLANNLFKLILAGRSANKEVLVRFALPAVMAAFLGAFLLSFAAHLPVIKAYDFAGRTHEITAVKLTIGSLIIIFSCFELLPSFSNFAMDKKYLPVGGLLSGFFGGLSGNQGALRSLFLIKAGLSKEEFIGTGVVSAVMVDFGRLIVYGFNFIAQPFSVAGNTKGLIMAAIFSAFIGSFIGRVLLTKITLRKVQILVGVMLVMFGAALSLGWI